MAVVVDAEVGFVLSAVEIVIKALGCGIIVQINELTVIYVLW